MDVWNMLVPLWLRFMSVWNGLRSGRWPPRRMPSEMRASFTMNGTIPVGHWYLNDIKSGHLVWTTNSPWWSPAKVRRREGSYYGSNDQFLFEALEKYPIDGQEVVIVGSEFPWYECIATTFGAAVTTIEYRPVDCRIPGLCVLTPDEFARCPRRFDAVISISSIEHDGLGRYGDPLNPDGDLTAMGRFRDLLKPGGRLFLAVPIGPDVVVWNAHRIYGPRRLPLLLSRWKQVAAFGWDDRRAAQQRLGNYLYQPVFVLEPTGA